MKCSCLSWWDCSTTNSPTNSKVPITLTVQPAILQAAFNPILVTLRNTAPAAGTSYYLQVYVIDSRDVVPTPSKTGRLVATPIRPAIGQDATFDLSGILQAELDQPQPVATNGHDASAYLGYYLRYGTVTYNTAGVQVLTQAAETDVYWALRAALPLSGSGSLVSYFGRASAQSGGSGGNGNTSSLVYPLTNRPASAEIDRASTVLLPVFFCRQSNGQAPVQRLQVQAICTFTDGSTLLVGGSKLDAVTGGVYLLDASPATLLANQTQLNQLVSFEATVYVSLEDIYVYHPLTVARTFTLRPAPLRQPLQVRFLNRRGGWDSLTFTRSREGQLKTKPVLYNAVSGERILRFDAESEETMFLPWLPASHEPWLRDLLLSPYVTVSGAYVKLKGHTLSRSNDDDLVSLTLTYQPEYDENAVTM